MIQAFQRLASPAEAFAGIPGASGNRDTWADIQPQDPSGVMSLDLSMLVVTPDGRGYGYNWHRATSDLYLVEGWS